MRKRIIPILLFMAISLAAVAQNSLVIYLTNGTTAVFPFAERPKITFAGETFKVASEQATIELPRTDVKTFKFEDSDATGIESTTCESATISTDGDNITINGIADGSAVKIIGINGQIFLTAIASNGSCSLSMESLPCGLYIISYSNTTIKYLKK